MQILLQVIFNFNENIVDVININCVKKQISPIWNSYEKFKEKQPPIY